MGLEIVDSEAFATGDKDFKAQMTNIASKNPDVVFCPIYYGEAGLAVQAARQAGCTSTFLGGDGFGSVKDYASADELEGTVYCSGYAPGTEDVAQFEKDYCETFGVEEVPNMFAPLAYDASMIMAYGLKAAEDAGLTAGTDEYKQAVIDAIKTMDGVKGITGSYSFDSDNNPIKSVAIIELTGKNGKRYLPIKDFYIKAGTVDINVADGEIQTAIIIPKESYDRTAGFYIKYAMRNAMDIATTGCSVNRRSEDKKTFERVRIAYGVAGPVPMRVPSAESFINGKAVTLENIETFSRTVLEDIHPRDSWRASKAFRQHIAVEMAKRCLVESVKRCGGDV